MQSDIKSCFSKAAHTYDAYAEFQYYSAQKLVNIIHDTPTHILDIGCGTGILTALLKQKFPHSHFTLVDISPVMLETAKAKLGTHHINYICASANDIDVIKYLIETYKIDMIVSNLCLQWLDNPEYLIKTYQGYTKTYISILLENSFYQWYQSVKKICSDFIPPISLLPSDITHHHDTYHIHYANGLAFLRSQKKLGTLANRGITLTVTQLKTAFMLFETEYNAKISYYLGIIQS